MTELSYQPARGVAARVHAHIAHQVRLARDRGETDIAPEGDIDAIESIIETAFWASLRREEIYTPTISLALLSPERAFRPLRFEPRLPLAPESLAQLGPAHVLIVGDPQRRDRRLELISAPMFGIVGEPMRITGRVIDNVGNAPVRVAISIDGQPAAAVNARANQPFSVDVRLPRRGRNMVVVEAAAGAEEITLANNRQAFAANGVRDRLRVLLITGEPHQGARVWRNLLKSDPAVDLVHFSILRPPDKMDFTPIHELALIPFPTQELFERRLDEFRHGTTGADRLAPEHRHHRIVDVEGGLHMGNHTANTAVCQHHHGPPFP